MSVHRVYAIQVVSGGSSPAPTFVARMTTTPRGFAKLTGERGASRSLRDQCIKALSGNRSHARPDQRHRFHARHFTVLSAFEEAAAAIVTLSKQTLSRSASSGWRTRRILPTAVGISSRVFSDDLINARAGDHHHRTHFRRRRGA